MNGIKMWFVFLWQWLKDLPAGVERLLRGAVGVIRAVIVGLCLSLEHIMRGAVNAVEQFVLGCWAAVAHWFQTFEDHVTAAWYSGRWAVVAEVKVVEKGAVSAVDSVKTEVKVIVADAASEVEKAAEAVKAEVK